MTGPAIALVVLAALLLTACESTQDTSSRLSQQVTKLKHEAGLKLAGSNPAVRVTTTTVLTDANGSAVVVGLRNTSARPQADVPVLIDVRDGAGHTVFRNDAPGLQRSLTHATLLPAGRELLWVNDQIVAATTPREVEAEVGAAQGRPGGTAVDLPVSGLQMRTDPGSGRYAAGSVRNTRGAALQRVQVSVIARRGGKVVAAGRGAVPRVPAHGTAPFRVFFIGDPEKASLTGDAQPLPDGGA